MEIVPIQSRAKVSFTHGIQLSINLEEITVNHKCLNSGHIFIVRGNVSISLIATSCNSYRTRARGVITSKQVFQTFHFVLIKSKAVNFQTMTHEIGFIHVKCTCKNININRSRNINRNNGVQTFSRSIHRNTSSVIFLRNELHLAINLAELLNQGLARSFISNGRNSYFLKLIVLYQLIQQILLHNKSIQFSRLINLVDDVLYKSRQISFTHESSFQSFTVDSYLVLNTRIHSMVSSVNLSGVAAKFSFHNFIIGSTVSREVRGRFLHHYINFLNSSASAQNTLIKNLPRIFKRNVTHNSQANTVNQSITEIVQTRFIRIDKRPCGFNRFSGILNPGSTTKSSITTKYSVNNTNSSRHSLITSLNVFKTIPCKYESGQSRRSSNSGSRNQVTIFRTSNTNTRPRTTSKFIRYRSLLIVSCHSSKNCLRDTTKSLTNCISISANINMNKKNVSNYSKTFIVITKWTRQIYHLTFYQTFSSQRPVQLHQW